MHQDQRCGCCARAALLNPMSMQMHLISLLKPMSMQLHPIYIPPPNPYCSQCLEANEPVRTCYLRQWSHVCHLTKCHVCMLQRATFSALCVCMFSEFSATVVCSAETEHYCIHHANLVDDEFRLASHALQCLQHYTLRAANQGVAGDTALSACPASHTTMVARLLRLLMAENASIT